MHIFTSTYALNYKMSNGKYANQVFKALHVIYCKMNGSYQIGKLLSNCKYDFFGNNIHIFLKFRNFSPHSAIRN